jgi:thiamine-phosphate pyrophosphorylase
MDRRQPHRKKPLPRIWLFTDPRLGDGLLSSIQCLPRFSGVIFRHYHLNDEARRSLYLKVKNICARRGHLLLLAADPMQAKAWHADGVHGLQKGSVGIRSAPVHDRRQIMMAKHMAADLVFLSPLYQTKSHPGAPALGALAFGRLAKLAAPIPVIALGGMNRAHAGKWKNGIIHGWAAIDAFKK